MTRIDQPAMRRRVLAIIALGVGALVAAVAGCSFLFAPPENGVIGGPNIISSARFLFFLALGLGLAALGLWRAPLPERAERPGDAGRPEAAEDLRQRLLAGEEAPIPGPVMLPN